MDKPEEEYEPSLGKTGLGGYVPSLAGVEITQSSTVIEEYNPDGGSESGYKPSLEYIEFPTKATVNEKPITMRDSGNQSETDSDTDSDPEFTPIPENFKKRNNLTDEEKNNYQYPVAVYDLEPCNYPKVPSVREIAIPPQVKMSRLGLIEQIMSEPVPIAIVESDPAVEPLNDESMVFDSERKPVGLIFETFGPVKRPFYSIRFNTMTEIEDCGLKIGTQIYHAEGFSEFVKLGALLAQKGSDASWENDKEVEGNQRDFSDDEEERAAKQKRKQPKDATKEAERLEKKRMKDEKIRDSTVYICGLPQDFRECDIKELFRSFGVRRVNLLKYPDGTSKSSGFVTCVSREKAEEAIEKLNMKLTLEGSMMPLAVKFSDSGARKRIHSDLDAPDKSDLYSNPSYIVTNKQRKSSTGDRYKVKERSTSASHTLHSLVPDEEDISGVKHAFTRPPPKIPSNPGSSGSTFNSSESENDIFNWGSDSNGQVGTISKNSRYSSSRIMPPELANPNQHPSPFEDPNKKKMKTLITPTSIKVDAVPKKEKMLHENIPDSHSNSSKNDNNPLVDYNSDSDSSDPENPSCMAFCSSKDRGVPQPKRSSSSSETPTPSDARRDSKVLNSLFAKAMKK